MLYGNDTFEHNGRTFRVEFPYDDSHGAPWDECDGHGPVSDWRNARYSDRPHKAPGERVLHEDRGSIRVYDMQEATRIAKRDGWGLNDADKAKLAARLGRAPTKGDIVAEAVERDFQYLRRWCNDQWSYVGVVVHLIDDDGDADPAHCASLWGIESDAHEYLEEVAHELAGEICAELDDATATDIAASRPDMSPDFHA